MWRKPHLHVELESEVPLSADFLKVSGENKTPQRSIHSCVCLSCDILIKISFYIPGSSNSALPQLLLCSISAENMICSLCAKDGR